MTSEDNIILDRNGGILNITINRPEQMNALDPASWGELADIFAEADEDASIGVIVLTGTGDKSFCAGGNLGELAKFDKDLARSMYRQSGRLFGNIRKARQPVIAAVNGYAIGGGNELALMCDLVIASKHAKFGQVGPKVGSSPIFGGTNLLSLMIGEKRAKEVVFLCRQYTADEACEMGWINKVVPHVELSSEVEKWCNEILDKSPSYIEISKVSSNVWWDMIQPGISHGEQLLMSMAGTPENLEGAQSFMEKRAPDFRKFRRSSSDD